MITDFINDWSIRLIPFLLAITVHELSHGVAADLLGDDLPRMQGRLTLNPIKHLDPLGLLVLLVSQMIGWAKPVMVNMTVIRRVKYGPLLVAAAGPVSNMLLALVSVLALKAFLFFNPPLPLNLMEFISLTLVVSIRINIVLAIFNLLPILPMDGGRILHNLLPPPQAYSYSKMEPYGMLILLALVFTGVTSEFLGPVFEFLFKTFYLFAVS